MTEAGIGSLLGDYYEQLPDPHLPAERIAFGSSGHRGSSGTRSFNEQHVIAITEAILRYRGSHDVRGPVFVGRDPHALSEPAFRTVIEVLVAAGTDVMLDAAAAYTPTPALSRAIVSYNGGSRKRLADGIILTASQNPPEDGGIKYNPPHGGAAGTQITAWIDEAANGLLENGASRVHRVQFERALRSEHVHRYDFMRDYVEDLARVLRMDAIAASGLRLGADPLGGASTAYWWAIGNRYELDLTVIDDAVDPAFPNVPRGAGGQVRIDCSSPTTMANLVAARERFDLAFGNDPEAAQHGIVTRGAGLVAPNHYLSAAASYLFNGMRAWSAGAGIGKTVLTTSMLDEVAAAAGRTLVETPVGFKWFAADLYDGHLGFAGEEGAGASLLALDGSTWTTDRDGIAMALLAAEMTAELGRDPADVYGELERRFGEAHSRRIDIPCDEVQRSRVAHLGEADLPFNEAAGDPVRSVLTNAGNGAPIGGLKVVTRRGWFAICPSGPEDVCRVYAESFAGAGHLEQLLAVAQDVVAPAASAPE